MEMIMNKNIKVIKEKINFSLKAFGAAEQELQYMPNSTDIGILQIRRHLRDNTFSIWTTGFSKTEEWVTDTHNVTTTALTNTWNFFLNGEEINNNVSKDKKLFLPEELHHNPGLSKLKQVSMTNSSGSIKFNAVMNYHLNMENTRTFVNSNQVIDLQSIKTITFIVASTGTKVLYTYNHLLLKPTFDRRNWKNIFKIFSYNDALSWSSISFPGAPKLDIYKKPNIDLDLIFHKGEISNLNIHNDKNMDIVVKKQEKVEKLFSHRVSGNISIKDLSYYDYNKHETFFGYGKGGIQGYIVPYSFKGYIYPKIRVTLNAAFKDLNLSTDILYKTKMLDKESGDIKLSILKNKIKGIKGGDEFTLNTRQIPIIAHMENPTLAELKRISSNAKDY